jgi:hypothetical protein
LICHRLPPFLNLLGGAEFGKGGSDTIAGVRGSEPEGDPKEGRGLARAGPGGDGLAAGGGAQRPGGRRTPGPVPRGGQGQAAQMAQARPGQPAGPPAQRRAGQADGRPARAALPVGGGRAAVLAGTADAPGPGLSGGYRPHHLADGIEEDGLRLEAHPLQLEKNATPSASSKPGPRSTD